MIGEKEKVSGIYNNKFKFERGFDFIVLLCLFELLHMSSILFGYISCEFVIELLYFSIFEVYVFFFFDA